MSPNFCSFPSELRNKIYELLLLHQEPIDPWVGYNRQKLTPGLFRANKIVHREASSLFYTQNRFNFTMHTPENVASFLEQIGRNNADYIRHICIDFPNFLYLDPGNVTLEDNSVRILAKIRTECAKLTTLTTSLYSTNAMELRLDALDHPKIVGEALKLVDTLFRAISSVQEIIVEVYEDSPNDHIRREMKSHGWTINAIEYVEEFGSDISFGDTEDYDYRYDDGDYDDEEYDIDNDSDFWRRAAD
ncbi:uncharacterized protein BDR25DRAFT_283222 [Lindgomyces ingoldianus]|uniref:Uncharacterized protein n=1 Tax=Lindgomyces ingoldianus TaxID=673940 RepID=A0ACB6R0J2_9PLEO|nr:uncharacterized protein BDR25DRAFT_283222 [Lindgomyces ingoldianus]KAF2472696.1 hypothetical protein BDR25DRAFT_283222 [Lindgomyces ingoldianus]